MSLQRPSPQALVIFGASGDLARRKILPALYNLERDGLMPEEYAVIGYARSEWDDQRFVANARAAVEKYSRSPVEESVWSRMAASMRFVAGEFNSPGAMDHLTADLDKADRDLGCGGDRLYYSATPPSAVPMIVERLGEIGPGANPRIVVEKPFGRNLESARALNEQVHRVFNESQVFRIDHYLGKETVQNLLVFRFANAMFERVWNRDAIDHVQITVAEDLGVEARGAYYEESGAIRDIVQNHMLQMLAFVAMEPPRALSATAIHDEKVKLLQTVRPITPENVVRAQYDRGTAGGASVPGYRSEDGVSPSSNTETYVAIRAYVDNWRWEGVPFLLRTGKRLPRRATEITVKFREAPGYLFDEAPEPDHLSIRIQPREGASFAFQAKQPGPGFVPRPVRMDFEYDEFFHAVSADAYERLLHDAMCGETTLFAREDGVERAWEIVQPVLDIPEEVYGYAAGSWGPRAADELIAPRRWHLG
ncbi:MAG: glucose-6-phosphate dehydrogenase [Actinomycetota bacterium]